jgi:hypothetical protein
MFSWTTTTLINEIPENFIKSINDGKALRIGKHIFEKRWVESIRKADGQKEELCEATLNLETVKTAMDTSDIGRLYIYIGLEGSEESIYANDWYRKGMPLSVSFLKDENPEVMATAIVDAIKKFNIFTKVKKILDVTASGNDLIIKGTHEHQRIQKIAVYVGDSQSIFGEEKAVISWDLSEYRYKASQENGADKAREYESKTGVTLTNAGRNGFGTYSQLLKDLRLPTANHNHWLSVHKDEMPVVGALYTQYIINYYAPSMSNPSFTAVGNRSMSETTHVFWVKQEFDADGNAIGVLKTWEDFLSKIDPEGDNTLNTTKGKVAKTYSNKKASLVERVETLENNQ